MQRPLRKVLHTVQVPLSRLGPRCTVHAERLAVLACQRASEGPRRAWAQPGGVHSKVRHGPQQAGEAQGAGPAGQEAGGGAAAVRPGGRGGEVPQVPRQAVAARLRRWVPGCCHMWGACAGGGLQGCAGGVVQLCERWFAAGASPGRHRQALPCWTCTLHIGLQTSWAATRWMRRR